MLRERWHSMRRPGVITASPPVRERRRRCWYAAPFRRFARASGGREPFVRACPHSSVDMRVGASTHLRGTLDEGTFRQRYGETVHHRTIDHVKTVGGI